MSTTTHTMRRAGRVVALVTSAAALAAPVANADQAGGSAWPYAKVLPYLNSTGPAREVAWPYAKVLPYLNSTGPAEPALGGGITGGDVRQAPATRPGFDWTAFGIGIGAGIGALLIVGAVATRIGRLRQLASA